LTEEGFMMIQDAEVREKLRLFIAGKLTLEAFEDWFLPHAWDSTSDLTAEVRLRLAEHDREDLTEAELVQTLYRGLSDGPFELVVSDTANEDVTPRSLVRAA
jgi:hypothetical protein